MSDERAVAAGEERERKEKTIPGEPIKVVSVILVQPCIVDGKQEAAGTLLELPENVASMLLGDGTAQTLEDAAKAKAANEAAAEQPERAGDHRQ